MPISPKTLLSVQYLRGMAALAVVSFHTGWFSPRFGQQGVDVFFVISGFIMMHVGRREQSPGVFLRARAIRVVPLYILATLAFASARNDWTWDHLLLSLALIPHLNGAATNQIHPVLVVGWTLLYETFFYACFAVSLLLPPSRRLVTLTVAFLGLAAAGLVVPDNTAAAQVYLSPLLLEFLAGAWLHRAWSAQRLPRNTILPFLLLAGSMLAFTVEPLPSVGWEARPILWGIPATAIVAAALMLERHKLMVRLTALAVIGDASYAIYLTHLGLLDHFKHYLRALPGPAALGVVLLVTTAVGVVVHLFVEKRLTQALRTRQMVQIA